MGASDDRMRCFEPLFVCCLAHFFAVYHEEIDCERRLKWLLPIQSIPNLPPIPPRRRQKRPRINRREKETTPKVPQHSIT